MKRKASAAQEIANVFVRHGLDYNGTKGPAAELHSTRDRKRLVERLTTAKLIALHVDTRDRGGEVHHWNSDKTRIVPITRELVNLLTLHVGERRTGPLFRSR